jgi:hypothetical protein
MATPLSIEFCIFACCIFCTCLISSGIVVTSYKSIQIQHVAVKDSHGFGTERLGDQVLHTGLGDV